MYLLVIYDLFINHRFAVTFDDIEACQVALKAYASKTGFGSVMFKLDLTSGIYEEIHPEVIEYEQK